MYLLSGLMYLRHEQTNQIKSNQNFRFILKKLSLASESKLTKYGLFKTRAAHFPILRDERTGMQGATLGKSGSRTASQLQGRTARAFSSNSLVKTMEMTAVIQ